MRRNRGLFNWGLFLIAAGLVAVGFRSGLLSNVVVGDIGRLWPLALVALGIALIAGHLAGSGLGGAIAAVVGGVLVGALVSGGVGSVGCQLPSQGREVAGGEEGDFTTEPANVQLFVTCGELRVTAGPARSWMVQRVGGASAVRIANQPNSLSVWTGARGGLPVSADRNRSQSAVTLPTGVPLDLRIEVSAGEADLELPGTRANAVQFTVNAGSLKTRLGDATISGPVNATVNAGSLKLQLPANGSVRGSITTNAGSVDLCVRPDSGVRIQSGGALGGNNFEEFGLRRSGNAWESSNYASAANKLDLSVTTNAGSTNLKPAGECT